MQNFSLTSHEWPIVHAVISRRGPFLDGTWEWGHLERVEAYLPNTTRLEVVYLGVRTLQLLKH